MKSKATTYILIVLALIVWGVVIWKVFRKPAGDMPALVAEKHTYEIKPPKDTLWLNYRDPFTGGKVSVPVKEVRATNIKPLPEKRAMPDRHDVRYLGRIIRRGEQVCLVEISGDQQTLRRNETYGGYRLVDIFEDSIRLRTQAGTLCVKLTL